jgi:hypothetical protein
LENIIELPFFLPTFCFWTFFFLALQVQYQDQKEDSIEQDQEIMMVIKDRRQGNFDNETMFWIWPLGTKEKLLSRFWWQL